MATAYCSDSGEEFSAGSRESDSDRSSDAKTDIQLYGKKPCRYYNGRGCKDAGRCSYLHFCKYALTGGCRYGSQCKLNHPEAGGESSSDPSTSAAPKLTDGRCYQWQLNDGNGWLDVANDHIIEAQYSLPHTQSIKLFNTSYGAVSIDFNRMRVSGKNLRVRRLDDGRTLWLWYCTLGRKWTKYGDEDPKGVPGPVKNSDIEEKFQSNPASSYTFAIGADTFEIKFAEMRQVTAKRKRKVERRPLYRQPPAGVPQVASALRGLALDTEPRWQFEGDRGAWHDFKRRSGAPNECSVTSDEIERKFTQNPHDAMTFKVGRCSYKLDFQAMIQTNLKNRNVRRIRRVLL
ncbi:uncharacterized protein si:ch211-244b2.4 isoform X1 [Pungitius pungitius]|uniref:uncharacterized protein si:ch211-244b2.4 isoform X1 n=1 Tax=Pungitius pungitius TaxID=134920 RepID=UPI002E0F3765